MKRGFTLLALIAVGLFVLAPWIGAQEEATETKAEAKAEKKAGTTEHMYVGVDGCKMCHKTAKTGDQYGKWLASSHAKAYQTLGTDAAKEVAAKAGIQGSPQQADQCLACHVTGHGAKKELLGPKFAVEEGVGCESCHGAGNDYKTMKVMKDQAAAMAAGLIMPTAETCQGCHNEKSPTFKGFDFAKMSATIAHPNPEKAAAKK